MQVTTPTALAFFAGIVTASLPALMGCAVDGSSTDRDAPTQSGLASSSMRASCAGLHDGYYCGGDMVGGDARVLYLCRRGVIASSASCSTSCTSEPAGTDDRCAGGAPPTNVHAAAGDGWAEVRWSGVGKSVFAVTSSPDGLTAHAVAGSTRARVWGLRDGVRYTFTVVADGGAASSPSNSVTPSASANVITDVLHHPQTRNLTCEEASLVMALSHQRITKTEDDVLAAIGIDWTPATFDSMGRLHWGDPYESFVGDPDGLETNHTGYGTYWPNIDRAARAFGAAVVRSGESVDPQVLYAAILAGHRVVAWVTSDWRVHSERSTWITDHGKTITWHGPEEHAVTLVGVEDGVVVVDNPLSPAEWQRIDKSLFEAVYAVYDRMAVILR